MDTPTANKSAKKLADLNSNDLFRYLTEYQILEFFNFENKSDFLKRNESCLVKHSNMLAFDFDNVEKIDDLERSILSNETLETQFQFVSPSGTGLKSIVKINTSKYDENNARQLSNKTMFQFSLKRS